MGRRKARNTRRRRELGAWSLAIAALAIGLAPGCLAPDNVRPRWPSPRQPPSDFSDLLRPQQTLVDVYFGGVRVGVARATYQPGQLRFDNPAAVARCCPT